MKIKSFFTETSLKAKKKRTIFAVVGILTVLLIIWFINHNDKPTVVAPVVSVAPVGQQDVEIYGDYVGHIRAQQFVEVRARVEGFLEEMHFEEGTYVNKHQVLFVINQDQYKAKVDKARAQVKKDKAQARKAERDLSRVSPLYEQNAVSQLDLDNVTAAYETADECS